MATYAKLKNGDWGVRVQGVTTVGATVQVTKRDGSSKTETIAKVLWSGEGISLCAIRPTAVSRPIVSRATSRSAGWHGNGCAACRAAGDWCAQCAFDEFDN